MCKFKRQIDDDDPPTNVPISLSFSTSLSAWAIPLSMWNALPLTGRKMFSWPVSSLNYHLVSSSSLANSWNMIHLSPNCVQSPSPTISLQTFSYGSLVAFWLPILEAWSSLWTQLCYPISVIYFYIMYHPSTYSLKPQWLLFLILWGQEFKQGSARLLFHVALAGHSLGCIQ